MSFTNVDYKYGENSIDLTFTGILYNKYYELKNYTTANVTLVRPLLYNNEDLDTYSMSFSNGHFYFDRLGGFSIGDDGDHSTRTRIRYFRGSADAMDHYTRSFE